METHGNTCATPYKVIQIQLQGRLGINNACAMHVGRKESIINVELTDDREVASKRGPENQ